MNAAGQVRAVIDAVLPAVEGGRFAVKRVAGVSRVEASLERRTAVVTFDARKTSAQAILAVIKDRAGFAAQLVRVVDAR